MNPAGCLPGKRLLAPVAKMGCGSSTVESQATSPTSTQAQTGKKKNGEDTSPLASPRPSGPLSPQSATSDRPVALIAPAAEAARGERVGEVLAGKEQGASMPDTAAATTTAAAAAHTPGGTAPHPSCAQPRSQEGPGPPEPGALPKPESGPATMEPLSLCAPGPHPDALVTVAMRSALSLVDPPAGHDGPSYGLLQPDGGGSSGGQAVPALGVSLRVLCDFGRQVELLFPGAQLTTAEVVERVGLLGGVRRGRVGRGTEAKVGGGRGAEAKVWGGRGTEAKVWGGRGAEAKVGGGGALRPRCVCGGGCSACHD